MSNLIKSDQQLFLDDLNKHISDFFSDYVEVQNVRININYNFPGGNDIDVCIANSFSEINIINCQYQKIRKLTALYKILVENFKKEFIDVICTSESYKLIIAESIKLYFTNCDNMSVRSYLQNIVNRCVNIYSSKTLYELIIKFIGEHNSIYSNFDKSIKVSIGEFIRNHNNHSKQQIKKENLILLCDADELCNRIINVVENKLIHKTKITLINDQIFLDADVSKLVDKKEDELEKCINKEEDKQKDMDELQINIRNMVKDINENINMEQMEKTMQFITKNKNYFPQNATNEHEPIEATIIMKFKLYYYYNFVLDAENKKDKKILEEYYDILFKQNIGLDDEMIKYFAKNKNKFNNDRVKNIEKNILGILLNK